MSTLETDQLNMTDYEIYAKQQVILALAEAGYVTYADVMKEFWVHVTNDPDVVAFMSPDEGTITFNAGLRLSQLSFLARHEILHEYFMHHTRMIIHFFKKLDIKKDGRKIDIEELTEDEVEEITQMIYSNKIFNYAGDYEISNRSYTDADKRTARSIYLNGKVVRGLVTEDDHPDWLDLSLEEMYDKLVKEKNKEWNKAQKELDEKDTDMKQPEEGGGGGSKMPPWLNPPVNKVKVIDGTLMPDGTFIDKDGNKR